MTRLTAILALSMACAFSAITVVVHVVRSDLNPARVGMSHYAIGRTRHIMTTGFAALGVACVSLGIALWSYADTRSAAGPLLRSSFLSIVAGVGIFAVALFPSTSPRPANWSETAHIAGALCFFVGMALSAIQYGWFHRCLASGSVVALVSGVLAVSAIGGMMLIRGITRGPQIGGLLQRVAFASLLAWIVVASTTLAWRTALPLCAA